jgi:beta-glucanase (GH16 family)
MGSFGIAKGNFTLPQVRRWADIRPQLFAALKVLYKRCVSAFVTLMVIVTIVAFMAYATFGLHLPALHIPGLSSNSATVGSTKLNLVGAAAVSNCIPQQRQSNPLFSNCPSFLANYSNQKNGAVDTNDFNVYSGTPVANQEAEYYTNNSSNVRVANGNLVLEAKSQSDHGYNFTSGRIDTQGKEDFLYGKIVVTAKLPGGIGTWPSIWMLPSQPRYASLSPASDPNRYDNDGEIDIAEAIGTQPNTVYGIAHSVAYPENGAKGTYFNTITLPSEYTAYHSYEVDWTPTSLTFSVDGQVYYTYTKQAGANWRSWPFNQPFYLVMNLALGGTWGGSDTKQFPDNGVDKSALPTSLDIQSINYYSYTGN